jgi:tetratricopeptide (TPR) repeat protein
MTPGSQGLLDAIVAINEGRLQDAALITANLPFVDSDIRDNADYHLLLGVQAQAYGKISLAVGHFETALGRSPRRADICERLGRVLLQVGDLRRAAHYLKKASQFSKHAGREEIFVFGDSHADFCFSGIPRCRPMWLGPMTMHRVGRDGLAAVNAKAHGVQEGNVVVFIFGEIDIRAHVTEQRDRHGRDLQEVIATLCGKYVDAVLANRNQYRQLRAIVSSVPPPLVGKNNPDIPFSTPIEERVAITRDVNQRLAASCAEHRLQFLDLYQYFVDPSGVMATGISDDVVHVRREFSDIVEYELDKLLEADG